VAAFPGVEPRRAGNQQPIQRALDSFLLFRISGAQFDPPKMVRQGHELLAAAGLSSGGGCMTRVLPCATLLLVQVVDVRVMAEVRGYSPMVPTEDTFERCEADGREAAADRMQTLFAAQGRLGARLVQNLRPCPAAAGQGLSKPISGDPPGTRTLNPLIKSQLLCQLS
jgi:hypothetical protein